MYSDIRLMPESEIFFEPKAWGKGVWRAKFLAEDAGETYIVHLQYTNKKTINFLVIDDKTKKPTKLKNMKELILSSLAYEKMKNKIEELEERMRKKIQVQKVHFTEKRYSHESNQNEYFIGFSLDSSILKFEYYFINKAGAFEIKTKTTPEVTSDLCINLLRENMNFFYNKRSVFQCFTPDEKIFFREGITTTNSINSPWVLFELPYASFLEDLLALLLIEETVRLKIIAM